MLKPAVLRRSTLFPWVAALAVAICHVPTAKGEPSEEGNGTVLEDDAKKLGHEISVGNGMYFSENGVNLLLRLTYGRTIHDGSPEAFDPIAPSRVVIANFDGIAVLTPQKSADHVPLSYMDLDFSLVKSQVRLPETNGTPYADLRLLPSRARRNAAIDQKLALKISVIGVQLGKAYALSSTDAARVYVQASANALGFALASHLSRELPDSGFRGMRVVGVGAEAGIGLSLRDQIDLKFALGGGADLNWWGSRFQSDPEAYASLRATLARSLSVYAQSGIQGFWDSRNRFFRAAPQTMIGMTLIYDIQSTP